MKKFTLVVVVLFFAVSGAFAQIHTPVKWQVAYKKTSNTEAVVLVRAIIDDGWHIYSTDVPSGGPIATSFAFNKSNDFTVVGKTLEPKPKSKYEAVFKMDVPYHSKEVTFQQKVKLNGKKETRVAGTVTFMACDATQCLPPDDYSFAVTIK